MCILNNALYDAEIVASDAVFHLQEQNVYTILIYMILVIIIMFCYRHIDQEKDLIYIVDGFHLISIVNGSNNKVEQYIYLRCCHLAFVAFLTNLKNTQLSMLTYVHCASQSTICYVLWERYIHN